MGQLHESVKNGNLDAVKKSLEWDFSSWWGLILWPSSVNEPDENGRTPLSHAAEHGHVHIIEYLTNRRGCNLNAQDNEGHTPLTRAVSAGKHQATKLLLQKGCDKEATEKKIKSAPHIAVANNNLSMITLLAEQGYNLDSIDGNGNTPLHNAVKLKFYDAASRLLQQGANKNPEDKNLQTPLHIAAQKNEWRMVSLLLDAHCATSPKNSYQNTPLHNAVFRKAHESVKLLLSKVADKNEKTRSGKTAVHLAVASGDNQMVEIVAAAGCDVNIKDNACCAPLHIAVKRKFPDVTITLLHNHADKDLPGPLGNTPIHIAATNGDTPLFTLLEGIGCGLNSKNSANNTPFHLAVIHSAIELVRYLLPKVADKNQKGFLGQTPLHFAVAKGNLGLVQLLVDSQCLLNVKDDAGQTPLHLALNLGHYTIARLLITQANNSGSDLDEINANGETALHLAVAKGPLDIVDQLLQANAISAITNNKKQTPLHFAVQQERYDIASLLIKQLTAKKIFNRLRGKGLGLDQQDDIGFTALHIAAARSDMKMVSMLITAGARIELQDNFGNTALHRACGYERDNYDRSYLNHHSNNSLVHLLISESIESGHGLDVLNNAGQSPLTLAQAAYNDTAVEMLRNAGCEYQQKAKKSHLDYVRYDAIDDDEDADDFNYQESLRKQELQETSNKSTQAQINNILTQAIKSRELAKKAFDKKDYPAALLYYKEILRLLHTPAIKGMKISNMMELHTQPASAAYKLGQYPQAIVYYRIALKYADNVNDRFHIKIEMVRCKTKLYMLQEALTDCNRLLRASERPNQSVFASAYSVRGNIKYKLNDNKSAVTDLATAIRLNPSIPKYYYKSALIKIALANTANSDDYKRTLIASARGNLLHVLSIDPHYQKADIKLNSINRPAPSSGSTDHTMRKWLVLFDAAAANEARLDNHSRKRNFDYMNAGSGPSRPK